MLCPAGNIHELLPQSTQNDELTVNTFHRRMVLSSDPEAIVAASGLQAIVDTPAKWPSNVWISFPDSVSQTLIAPSAPAPPPIISINQFSPRQASQAQHTTTSNHRRARREPHSRNPQQMPPKQILLPIIQLIRLWRRRRHRRR